jgi:bis(5'-nucleosyl)-tetraphosphatase (symmetrical)
MAQGTLFVGDVHGCADELGRLLKKTRPARVILLGDLFTRGPDPAGVWKLIRRWDAEAVLGNHDEVVLADWKPGKQLPRRAFKWLRKRPLTMRGPGWVAVHAGVHPVKGPERTCRAHALHMKQWRGRPWWKRYCDDFLVLHGHDAKRGLIDRRPYTLGLDTGCIRGGRLSGYLLERDQIVDVQSRM